MIILILTPLVNHLTLTIVLSLFNPYINITSQKFSSTPFHLLFITPFQKFLIVHLPVVQPRSYRVIYYFDTSALGIRHQSFDRVRNLCLKIKHTKMFSP